MLDVGDILPSPLTPLVLPHPVPELVCEMKTPAFFKIAQSSPQPQSMDTADYARVNPLPSPATSSFSSGELDLYIEVHHLSCWPTKLLTRAPPSSRSTGARATSDIWNNHSHSNAQITTTTPACEYFLLG